MPVRRGVHGQPGGAHGGRPVPSRRPARPGGRRGERHRRGSGGGLPPAARPDARWRRRARHAGPRRRRPVRPRGRPDSSREPGVAVRRGAVLHRRAAALPPSGRSRVTTIETPLRKVLGDRTARALATHLDLHTAGDLIYHFPRRYDERGEHTDMRQLQVGEQVTLLAQVQSTTVRPMRARKGSMLEVTIGDGAGATLTCTFFNQAWRERDLRRGRWGLFAGKVTEFRG